jgi:hypothetical protein
MNSVSRHVSRIILNDWDWDKSGVDLLRRAKIPSVSFLAFKYGLCFLFSCQFKRRRYGLWVENQVREERRGDLRSQLRLHGHEVSVPEIRLESLRKLQPYRLANAWNSLPFQETGIDPEVALRGKRSLQEALHLLFPVIPPAIQFQFGVGTI